MASIPRLRDIAGWRRLLARRWSGSFANRRQIRGFGL
jgi:hypothetical protein